MIELACSLCAVLAGTAVGCVVGCIPGLHVYNVMALFVLGIHAQGPELPVVASQAAVLFMAGMVVGWATANTLPSVLLAAPDESALLMVLPGQSYAMRGRGFDAVMLSAAGGLGGTLLVIVLIGPLAPAALPVMAGVFRRHNYWIVWAVIMFMLLSEWPKLGTRGQGGWGKLATGLLTPVAGLFTFMLSGFLGIVLRYRSPVPPASAFQGMMPAFAGLFAVPWLLLNAVSGVRLPRQTIPASLRVDGRFLLRGTAAGFLGGAFAAFFPGITGGIGGLLAGHATAQNDNRVFLISQGASKAVYYVGAMLFFFVPGGGLSRGSAAWMIGGFHIPRGAREYCAMLAAVAIAGAASFLLTAPLARGMIRVSEAAGYRRISLASLAAVCAVVFLSTGIPGLVVMTVAAGIGLMPVLFHSRRINCMGVVLLPMALGMSGLGALVRRAVGLM